VQGVAHLRVSPVVWYRELDEVDVEKILFLQHLEHWADGVEQLAAYYRQFGTGLFAEYRALRWQAGKFVGIRYPDAVKLNALVGYESQRDALLKNTEFLLSGEAALHVLLYGSRGSGKSSLVKALLNEYSDGASGKLRLLEVAKSDLKDLPQIVEKLRGVPQKFIIFVDDLSFEEDDDAFKALKVVLEGNLTARPQNVVVYATSNRRHLIREFFADRPNPKDNEEVYAWDTMQEKLSFSDRFGLTLTFEAADQKTYLKIVNHLAAQAKINLSQEDLEYQALQWATRHNGRSGRTARQFVDFLKADLARLATNKNTSDTQI
jgi:predicted AAA+ superfamily ATPase